MQLREAVASRVSAKRHRFGRRIKGPTGPECKPNPYGSADSRDSLVGGTPTLLSRKVTVMNDRRHFITGCSALSAASLLPAWAFADELTRTPTQTEGPFYPDRLPLDTDNDLLIINDGITQAIGQVTHLTGRVLDMKGDPVRNALVEIWQVDGKGRYLHSQDAKRGGSDRNFQGFGRFLTGSKGAYYFRTVKPVPYPGRTPHIHVAVKLRGKKRLVTQCYIKGETQNRKDGVLNRIKEEKARNSLLVDFRKVPDSRIGELQARFDIVLGFTPEG